MLCNFIFRPSLVIIKSFTDVMYDLLRLQYKLLRMHITRPILTVSKARIIYEEFAINDYRSQLGRQVLQMKRVFQTGVHRFTFVNKGRLEISLLLN
jgi:hypothetical protein